MKKRMLSILLTLCMVLSLLPATAMAGGGDISGEVRASTYAELVSYLNNSAVTTLYIEGQWLDGIVDDGQGNITEVYKPFVWPAGEEAVTLNLQPANTTCKIYMSGGEWIIPENVTVNAYSTVYCSSAVVINGTWNCMSNQAIIGNVSGSDGFYGSLTVNGTLTVAKDLRVSPAQVGSFTLNGTLENAGVCYINHMTMADGAEVVNIPNPELVNSMREIYLVDGGSITGPGTGSASIGGQITVNKTGTLGGNLTADQIVLYNGSTLTVADGADVTINKLSCNGTSSNPAVINLNGKLSLTTNGYNTVSYTTITLGENGVLALTPNVQFGGSDSGSTITGDGTLELYGILNESGNCSQAPMVFSVSSYRIDTATGDYVPLTGVTANVVRKWTQCQSHTWGEVTTVDPTCSERGYDTATCSACGTEKRSNYVVPTGNHTITYTQNGTSSATATCSVCGWTGRVSISVPQSSYVATGAPITPAVLTKMGSLGENIPDAEITYTNNVEPGTATASATFGSVTISVTFEISECAHEHITAATCTAGPTCSDCGKELGDPLGHTGGTATCQEQATCTREGCGEKYGDLADHSYVLKSNADMHWVECSVCGLKCVEDYGIAVEDITDEVRLELIYAYLEQQGEQTQEQAIYLEQYGDTPTRHAWSGASCTEADHCLLCGYEKAAGSHSYTAVVTDPTCTEQGYTTHTCSRCGDSYKDTYVDALGHDWSTNDCAEEAACKREGCGATRPAGTHVCTYTASGAVLTETCGNCDHTATATLSVSDGPFSYTGTAITPASVAYGDDWQGERPEVTYSNNILAGTATASVTLGGATVSVSFTISPEVQTLSWSGAEGSLSTTYGTPIAGKTAVKDKADGGTITYISSNESAVKVDSTTGALTIVGVGEAKITASASAVEGKYTASAPIEYYVTVSARRVTVATDDKTRVYGGENPALTFTVPDGALVGSDTAADLGITLTTQAIQTSPVGEYAITGSGSSKNYAVTVTPGTLTITPAPLTVKPKDVTIYVGDTLPAQLELAYTGLVNGDTLTPAGTPGFILKNGDAELADSNTAGTYTILWTNPEEVTFDNANYSVTRETTGTLTIAQRSSGGGGTAVTPDEPEITTGGSTTVAEIEAEVTTSGTTSRAAVSQDALDKAIEAAESAAGKTGTDAAVEIVVNTPANAAEVQVDLPAEGLENFAGSESRSLTISSGVGTVTISPEAAASIAEQAQGDTVTVTIREVTQPEKTLNERQLAAVGDALVYDLSVTSNGQYISQFDGGLITVSLPYTLKTDEDPNGVVVYYVDDLGNIQRVRAMYDVKTQSIIFTTNHFSFYTVGYDANAAAAARFTDVPFDAYYQSAVGWAASHGVTSGVTETTFAPGASCTRAQAVTFLWRAAGSPAPESGEMPFTDVAADAYYYDAVLWAVENGITSGTSADTFSPDATCTRAQIVTFLWRSQSSPAAGSVNPFTDVAADAYYASAVLWAVDQEITDGTSADMFSPAANCTRAQIVTFLWRCMGE